MVILSEKRLHLFVLAIVSVIVFLMLIMWICCRFKTSSDTFEVVNPVSLDNPSPRYGHSVVAYQVSLTTTTLKGLGPGDSLPPVHVISVTDFGPYFPLSCIVVIVYI